MGWYENRTEMARYIAELKQLLAGTALSPDARARALAALIEADAMTQAADQMHTAAEIAMVRSISAICRSAAVPRATRLVSVFRRLRPLVPPAGRVLQNLPSARCKPRWPAWRAARVVLRAGPGSSAYGWRERGFCRDGRTHADLFEISVRRSAA
jgi:hypothetical protein